MRPRNEEFGGLSGVVDSYARRSVVGNRAGGHDAVGGGQPVLTGLSVHALDYSRAVGQQQFRRIFRVQFNFHLESIGQGLDHGRQVLVRQPPNGAIHGIRRKVDSAGIRHFQAPDVSGLYPANMM